MTSIKNFEGFKKSLLNATNGTIEETFDNSKQFDGQEYRSYRIYTDYIHYFNMFVIHNLASNTYDVSLETSDCAVSTMSKVVKTQKAMIESVVRWCYYSYLNEKKISCDSEEYTDRCEKTSESEKSYADYTSEDCINAGIAKECTDCPDFREEDCIENVECANGCDVFEGCKTVKSVREVDKVCGDCSHFNACRQGNQTVAPTCCMFDSLYKARKNLNWHNVSLKTLANIDIDTLDETRQIYMHVRYQLNTVIKAIYKCNLYTTMDILRTNIIQHIANLVRNKKVNRSLLRYAEAQIENCYLVNGVISSKYAGSYSEKSSRAYNKYFCL